MERTIMLFLYKIGIYILMLMFYYRAIKNEDIVLFMSDNEKKYLFNINKILAYYVVCKLTSFIHTYTHTDIYIYIKDYLSQLELIKFLLKKILKFRLQLCFVFCAGMNFTILCCNVV